jgi:hypothetical protein
MSSGSARPSAVALLALAESAMAESYCGEPRRDGKSHPTDQESEECQFILMRDRDTVQQIIGRLSLVEYKLDDPRRRIFLQSYTEMGLPSG